jgi:serine/threonine protein kinase
MSEREHMKGKKLKQYNFLFKLGGGVYGTVYKALDTKTENIVAIKVINK